MEKALEEMSLNSFSKHLKDAAEEKLMSPISSFAIVCWITLCVIVIVAVILNVIKGRSQSTVPGPWQFPLIGTVIQISRKWPQSLQLLRKRYGDVFRIKIGCQEIVVLSGLDTVKEALLKKSYTFSGRPHIYSFQFASEGKSLAFNTYSESWKQHKKMAERALEKFLHRGNFVNKTIAEEAEQLRNQLMSYEGQPINPRDQIFWSVGHVIYKLCYGDDCKDPAVFEFIMKKMNDFVKQGSGFLNFFPILRNILWWKTNQLRDNSDSILTIAKTKELEHFDTYKEGTFRCCLDTLIEECHKNSKFDKMRILHTVQDFHGAGHDIVTGALLWAVIYLTQYPDIQEKVKLEVEENIGHLRSPCKEDIPLMPYTQAFILEVLRHGSVVPVSVPHATMENTIIHGYFLPKDTFIIFDFVSVHRDSSVWGDADLFRPERFLDAYGQVDKSVKEKFLGFSLGHRQCPGKALSKQIMFIYICTLLQKHCFTKPHNVTAYDLDPIGTEVLQPKPYNVMLETFKHTSLL